MDCFFKKINIPNRISNRVRKETKGIAKSVRFQSQEQNHVCRQSIHDDDHDRPRPSASLASPNTTAAETTTTTIDEGIENDNSGDDLHSRKKKNNELKQRLGHRSHDLGKTLNLLLHILHFVVVRHGYCLSLLFLLCFSRNGKKGGNMKKDFKRSTILLFGVRGVHFRGKWGSPFFRHECDRNQRGSNPGFCVPRLSLVLESSSRGSLTNYMVPMLDSRWKVLEPSWH